MTIMTERDLEILKFINKFGFCEMQHLDKYFQLKKPNNYQIMRRLKKAGWIQYQQVFSNKSAYWLNKSAATEIGSSIPAINRPAVAIYTHEVLLIDLYFELQKRYKEANFISEREIIKDKYFDGFGKKGHVSDGLLIFPDKKVIAIELELTLKSTKRIEHIFRAYKKNLEIDEVWYFCDDKIFNVISRRSEDQSHIKVHHFQEYLSAK